MLKFRHLLAAILICSTLATICAFAQSSLTQIQGPIINSDGTPFNGMVVITWNGFSVPSGTPVSQLSASAQIYNGTLSVLLVPTTTATAGTYYQVVYSSSDGTVTWTETWQVPPSTTPLTVSQVRASTTQGSNPTAGSGGYATLPISISQVTGLSSDLSSLNTSVTTLNTEVASLGTTASIAALQNAVNALSGTVSGLSTTVTGLSTTVAANGTTLTGLQSTVTALSSTTSTLTSSVTGLTATLTGLSTTVAANGTTLTGLQSTVTALSSTTSGLTSSVSGLTTTVNGLNTTVASNSTSITSLTTGLGTADTTITGLSSSIATLTNTVTGLVAAVAALSTGSTSNVYVDAQTPSGTENGSNDIFDLASSPSPATSLALYRNGLLQETGVDFTLSGAVITFLAVSTPKSTDILQAFYRLAGAGTNSTIVDSEVPSGTINGTNLAFTLANTPVAGPSVKLYKNGLLLSQNGDYSVVGKTITFATAATTPQVGDTLVAAYRF
jgi:prefoldin subunit 5